MSYPSYQKNSFYNRPKQPLTKRNDVLDRSSFHQNIENQFNIQRPYNVCNTEQSDYGYGTPEKTLITVTKVTKGKKSQNFKMKTIEM